MTFPKQATVRRAVELYLEMRLEDSPRDDEGEGPRLLVAFSGGPDSLALLHALVRRAAGRAQVHAAHLDHGLDPGSAERARRAAELARRLGLTRGRIHLGRVQPPEELADGPEAWARRERYAFLERVARDAGCARILTAHHAGDQAETVLLRLLHGSGIEGLAGIRASRGAVDRPLLDVGRREIDAAVARIRDEDPRLVPVEDPTNADPRQPRALARHHLLPRLREEMHDVDASLRSLGDASRRLRRRLHRLFEERLAPRTLRWGGVGADLDALLALPDELRPHALAFLHRRAGVSYPASAAARRELERQIGAGGAVAVDCGGGWAWRARRGLFRLQPSQNPPAPFTYTRRGPGTLAVPELDLAIRFAPADVEPWMFRGERRRAALHLPHASRPLISVRTRRPGDALRPLGSSGRRSVKDLLIDRRVPRHVRDRLPLLFVDGILAWVPGVTVDERFRLPPRGPAWLAEIRRGPDDEDQTESHTIPTRTSQR